jgi:hypothetical protein
MTPMRVDFPYLMADRDRHGNARLYVRRYGRKIRIRKKLGTEAFALAYADALRALEQDSGASEIVKAAPAGTFGWLAARYFASIEFKRLDRLSQTTRRLVIESCLREPRKPDSRDVMRDCPISVLSAAHVKMLRSAGRASRRGQQSAQMAFYAFQLGGRPRPVARESGA